ncbi:MAG: hypothetical protein IPN89_10105 [Saprospiraceae bacterium]|nr:hypothetical protein [Saprospiraceae bacterium]
MSNSIQSSTESSLWPDPNERHNPDLFLKQTTKIRPSPRGISTSMLPGGQGLVPPPSLPVSLLVPLWPAPLLVVLELPSVLFPKSPKSPKSPNGLPSPNPPNPRPVPPVVLLPTPLLFK